MKGKLYCIGTITADLYHTNTPVDLSSLGNVNHRDNSDDSLPIGYLNYYLGGTATNVAVGLSHFQVPVHLIAKVGPDQLGDNLLKIIGKYPIKYNTEPSVKPTSMVVVNTSINTQTVTFDSYSQGTAYSDLQPSDLPILTTSDDIIVLSSTIYSHYQLQPVFFGYLSKYCRRKTLIVLDLNVRQHHDCQVSQYKNYILSLIEFASLIKGTLTEYQFVYGISEDQSQGETLKQLRDKLYLDKLYIITLGEEGCVFFHQGSFHTVSMDNPISTPVNVVGAGDSFLVGCLVQYRKSGYQFSELCQDFEKITQVCQAGNRVAREIVQRHGTICYDHLPVQIDHIG